MVIIGEAVGHNKRSFTITAIGIKVYNHIPAIIGSDVRRVVHIYFCDGTIA